MPNSLDEDVPPWRWVQIGTVVGLAVLPGLLVVYAVEVGAAWRGERRDQDGDAARKGGSSPGLR